MPDSASAIATTVPNSSRTPAVIRTRRSGSSLGPSGPVERVLEQWGEAQARKVGRGPTPSSNPRLTSAIRPS